MDPKIHLQPMDSSTMSLLQPKMLTSLCSNFDERQWIKQIRQTLDEELEEVTETPVTIFAVPKALLITDRSSYIPHQVAIGPYHHFRPELSDMERHKIAAAKRSQRKLQAGSTLHEFVDHLIKYELRIRASYDRQLPFGCEALMWMLEIDACFLLEFFQVCGVKRMDSSRKRVAHNAILRDIIMLENQIPLFVMRMLLEVQLPSQVMADEVLLHMLMGVTKELSPFRTAIWRDRIDVQDHAHLLGFLYCFIVPKSEVEFDTIEIHEEEVKEKEDDENEEELLARRQLLDRLWKTLSNWVIFSKPAMVIEKLPWNTISKMHAIKMLKGRIKNMLGSFPKDENTSSSNTVKPPLLEEATIPTVTQLVEVGVRFMPSNGGIGSIAFDRKSLTLCMPVITLDVNSEVVLRNLIAYEACAPSGAMVLTRYTELMNGMIETRLDAKILCQNNIIINHLKGEQEVADLWTGMNKFIKMTREPTYDEMITDVNRYYNTRWKVVLRNFLRKYVYKFWRILTFLATVLLLLIMSFQAFCEVYSCRRLVPDKALGVGS